MVPCVSSSHPPPSAFPNTARTQAPAARAKDLLDENVLVTTEFVVKSCLVYHMTFTWILQLCSCVFRKMLAQWPFFRTHVTTFLSLRKQEKLAFSGY